MASKNTTKGNSENKKMDIDTNVLSMFRISLKNQPSVARDKVKERYQTYFGGDTQSFDTFLRQRNTTDAIRAAVSNLLKDESLATQKDLHTGKDFRVISCSAKVPQGEMRIDFHLQEKGSEVNYASLGHFFLRYKDAKKPEEGYTSGWVPGEHEAYMSPVLRSQLQDTQGLIDLGQNMVYDTDIRRIFNEMSERMANFGRSTILLVNDSQRELVEKFRGLFSNTDTGHVKFYQLDLHNTATNREALMDMIQEDYQETFTDLLSKLRTPGVVVKPLRNIYDNIRSQVNSVQIALGLSYSEEFVNRMQECEDILEVLEIAAAAAKQDKREARQAAKQALTQADIAAQEALALLKASAGKPELMLQAFAKVSS